MILMIPIIRGVITIQAILLLLLVILFLLSCKNVSENLALGFENEGYESNENEDTWGAYKLFDKSLILNKHNNSRLRS